MLDLRLIIQGSVALEPLARRLIEHKEDVLPHVVFMPPLFQEWRRVSIPEWRTIPQESQDWSDQKRAGYARWMLRDVLLDPDYDDPDIAHIQSRRRHSHH